MNLEQLKESGRICLETICGSNCYGLNIATSDIDITGIFLYDKSDMLRFDELPSQVSDAKSDVKFYNLKEFFKLALKGSPNMIELLFIDERFHKKSNTLSKKLIANRDMFISQKCYYSFVNYAFAQIKKAKGQNKWINNPKPKDPPNAIDYMYSIAKGQLDYFSYGNDEDSFACRPVKMESSKGYKLSRVEHGFGIYRMYNIDETFDFLKSGKIECSSISKEEERKNFAGLLSFNEVKYDQDCKDWKNYWGWMKNRNEHRWTKQESGELDYDCYLEKETEFLTDSGWKKFDKITNKDKLGTVNSNNELIYQDWYDKFDEVVEADFHTYESSYVKFSVTGNHKLYFSDCHRSVKNNFSTKYIQKKANWNLQTVDEYFDGKKSFKHILTSCESNSQDEFEVEDSYLKLLAMYICDGSILYNRNKEPKYVTISQLENNPYCSIAESISDFDWSRSSTERKGRNEFTYIFKNIADNIIKDAGIGSYNKHLPTWINKLSKRQFDLFFDVLIKGDGYTHKTKGYKVYYSNSKRLIDELQVLFFQNSLEVQIYKNHINDKNKCYQLFISKDSKNAMAMSKKLCLNDGINKTGWKKFKSKERIVCFSVESSILITRNDDKIAVQGNSKNALHCIRLLYSAHSILTTGKPNVYVNDTQREHLLKIRNGDFSHEEILKEAEELVAKIDKAKKDLEESDNPIIPKEVNRPKLLELYNELMDEFS